MTPEKAKQILDAALRDGSFPLGFLKSMAVGVARSGKTLSKNHVFKMMCDPNFSVSTGVCEAPILAFRQLTLELIKALPSAEGFELLKYEDINQFLAYVVRKGLLKGRVAKVVKEMVQAASKGSSSSDRSEGVAASSVGTGSGDSAASTDVVNKVVAKAEEYSFEKPLFKLQIILFLDSGGQPQFHEVVAAFSHNVSLVLVFIKLNERLDALCTNAFTDKEGKWFTEQCPSLLTNEQMVVQFVHAMMCKPVAGSEGMHTKFMVIGTHRDLMHECNETLEEKNERLASLFLPALEENLVMNGDDIIFAVNAKKPDKNDDKCFDLIREKVADLSGALDVDTPIAFLMLLNDVNKYAEEQRKKVVSMEEFQAIAGRLKMERQSLEAALVFFNKMSVWMYVPSVLPGAVFVDPQMPLDSINRIVQYSFRVRGGAIPGLAASECRLWKEGVVSSEMLKGEEFRGCFVRGLFEADDALKLFEKLFIVAPLNEREFVMPAMLQTVAEKDMERYVPAPSEHVSPLFLHFHMSRIAKGVFCSTHTCMRSKYGWTTAYTMVKSKKVPACLFRNAVRLQHPTKAVEITLLHSLKHFEVHLDASQADLPIICPEIRDMLMDAVDSAASAFRFKNSRASVAFQCPCSPDDVHTATPNEAHSMLICKMTQKKIRGPLTSGQRVWLGPRTAPGETFDILSQRVYHVENVVPFPTASTQLHGGSLQTSAPPTNTATSADSSSSPSSTHLSSPPTRMSESSSVYISSLPPSSPPSSVFSDYIQLFSTADKKPTLPELLSFPTHSGEPINIITKVGVNYEMLGTLLLKDNDGSIMPTITFECNRNTTLITTEVLRRWLRGAGKQPVTWRTLTDSLKSIGLSPLASSIEHSLK